MADLLAGAPTRDADWPETKYALSTTVISGFTGSTFIQTPLLGVTFIAPTTGRVLIHWASIVECDPFGLAHVSIAVRTGGTIGSGTVVSAASTPNAITTGAKGSTIAANKQMSNFRCLSGLTTGSTYNVCVAWSMEIGGAGNIYSRSVLVQPLS